MAMRGNGVGVRPEGLPDSAQPAAKPGVGAAGAGATPAWQPQQLDSRFSLDDALDRATQVVTQRMNWNLRPDGLVVRPTQQTMESAALTRLQVTDMQTQAVLREYDVPTFLGLYAAREKSSGVVVDGRV